MRRVGWDMMRYISERLTFTRAYKTITNEVEIKKRIIPSCHKAVEEGDISAENSLILERTNLTNKYDTTNPIPKIIPYPHIPKFG
jgi:hypothetical protein